MTAEFDQQLYPTPNSRDLLVFGAGHTNQSIGAINMLKRDRFELLSAYLDGEVTAAERRQVEAWLANDPEIQRLYGRLIKLRQGLRTMPVPPAQHAEQTVQQVFARLDRRPKIAKVWGGAAVAAVLISILPGVLPRSHSSIHQLAQSPQQQALPENVMIALNSPVVEIPAALAVPEKGFKKTSSPH